jgi:kumamolisin
MRTNKVSFVATLAAALATAALAPPPAYAARPMAIDLGPADSAPGNERITLTVALKLRNTEQLESLIESIYDAAGPQFRHFLTTEEFKARFGPTSETIEQVTRHFEAAGLQVSRATVAHLSVAGSAAAIEAEFGVHLHAYAVPATSNTPSYRFRSPVSPPQISPAIADAVRTVFGLDTRPHYRPHLRHATAHAVGRLASVTPSGTAATANAPGALTVADFAQIYDVGPLYERGLRGRHSALGIVTLASFTPSDAYAYWDALDLEVSSDRIHEVQIDGGSGPISDAAGSLETTIDVEQSGGLAPGSRIEVFEAPNTSQGFIDAFAAAIDQNRVDTLSCSWGQWEYFDVLPPQDVTDPSSGNVVTSLKALEDLFAQAALQGQSVYVAAGDQAAYDSVEWSRPPSYPFPPSAVVLSVDDPAAQRWVTAMGGTTLPSTQTFAISATQNYSVTIASEQAWGWDYLIQLCNLLGLDPLMCGIFPAGGGGGVSAYVPRPFYQHGVPGIRKTEAGQTLIDYTKNPPVTVVTLPGGFAGRNVPDISLNSDPDTGYAVYYTSSVSGFGVQNGWGGTSFAAPQFNGVTALYNQALGRVGLLNPALYALVRRGEAYGGENAPLRDIVAGDNWHYHAHAGYDQATGVGVPDFENLFQALRQ